MLSGSSATTCARFWDRKSFDWLKEKGFVRRVGELKVETGIM